MLFRRANCTSAELGHVRSVRPDFGTSFSRTKFCALRRAAVGLCLLGALSSCAVFETRTNWGFDFRNEGPSRIYDLSIQYGPTAINRSCTLSCAPGSSSGEMKFADFPKELVVTWYLERGAEPIVKVVPITPFPAVGIDHSIGVRISDRDLKLYRMYRKSSQHPESVSVQIYP